MSMLLNNLTLKNVLSVNILITIFFMIINSILCEEGLSGGECVKHKDNFAFTIQICLNLILTLLVVLVDRSKAKILILNIGITLAFFVVAGTLYSISKAGFF